MRPFKLADTMWLRSCAPQIRWDNRSEMPVALAIARPRQWGRPSYGGSVQVIATARATVSTAIGSLTGWRISRSRPSAKCLLRRARMRSGPVAIRSNRLQPFPIGRAHDKADCLSHARRIARYSVPVNRQRFCRFRTFLSLAAVR